MEDLIAAELERRKALWEEMKKYSEGKVPIDNVPVSFVKSQKVYKGGEGTYVDVPRTSSLVKKGVTVSVRLKGNRYQNEISDDCAQFEYPDTNRKGAHDANKIQASKNALELDLPIFVIIGERNKSREGDTYKRIELAQVVDFNNEEGFFLVEFLKSFESKPTYTPAKETDPFKLKGGKDEKTANVKVRSNQPKFSFGVKNYYGRKCAVCDIRHKDLLDAAHIVGKADDGSDHLLNGLVLCKNHHAAFDNYLFGINPESQELIFSLKVTARELNIPQQKLETGRGKLPHVDALEWKWKAFQKANR